MSPCSQSPAGQIGRDSPRHVHSWPADTKRRDRVMPWRFSVTPNRCVSALPEELVEYGDAILDHCALGMVAIKIQLTCLVNRELLNRAFRDRG